MTSWIFIDSQCIEDKVDELCNPAIFAKLTAYLKEVTENRFLQSEVATLPKFLEEAVVAIVIGVSWKPQILEGKYLACASNGVHKNLTENASE